ncbi:nucleotidyl transferase AbiEii/AbiGii toxin family protein [Croceitalea sp. MTPC9]|uniref:Nucleotidyl transferase AbiEii/AbiGii toxin family protein n=2 Tax=Flavobacteriaceae TaxID=49546 RepID=A0ABW5MSQ8_9FLAO|nr:nucleotidyl transferase AbiEii/AbiGii toxin family protein [Euzebyella saccharophila]GMN11176.1 nucleotidyl transferase AbiEii/AbiGii toxin family protein [Croceitalea sp. MTPC6]GMN17183.1 nucleotidyl transferase AbiEii/AbiGii toxin family protein [Croceitalea sp. MTPC9]|tara:strand:- start:27846 stop:28883 length:1038 start_codon:yes stop_codon:yes gene_type:complete
MDKTKFYNIPEEDRLAIYKNVENKTGIPDFAVEKDWWVVQTLKIIFEMGIAQHLVFKGGTSLSKAWKLIERFSEDIDLAVDRGFFGYSGELSKKQLTKLRKETSSYISGEFYLELQERFKQRGFKDVDFNIIPAESSDQDPRIIEIYYPYITKSPGYIQPRVQVEIGCRSLREPFDFKPIYSFVDEQYPDAKFVEPPVSVPSVTPERTFLEKLFLLHEEFQRPKEKIRVDRLSRHLYDIFQLSKTEFANNAIRDKGLYEIIVNHRFVFTKLGGVDYNLHQPQHILPIPSQDFDEAWKSDYRTMQEQMIYGDSPAYEDLVKGIQAFLQRMNALDWRMKLEFPKPKS